MSLLIHHHGVRIVSFTHVDDIGVYIYLTNPPTNGTLEFWPYGTVGEDDFFTTVDFYQLILVRNDDGLIKIYINGEEFAEYDDSVTQKFIPGEPDNFIVFFRDHPSVLANEASPGFVSDIIIGNEAWTPEEVVEVWEDFCGSLLEINEITETRTLIFPNPAQDVFYVSLENTRVKADVQIFDLTGRMFAELRIQENVNSINISFLKKGMYLIKIIQDSNVEIYKIKKE
ncbi:MAG: T9SS type A sorting domain-containing protein [Bacteroidales bacterium]|nr:T9SS type A sorting domain-containing protein [Bacteroidales bacterium]